jgi:hypothetical protein
MAGFLLALIAAGGLAFIFYLVFNSKKNKPRGHDLYICPSCGEHDCHCHKQQDCA